jgi:hypothetical protein
LQDGSTFGKFEGGKNESNVIDVSIGWPCEDESRANGKRTTKDTQDKGC